MIGNNGRGYMPNSQHQKQNHGMNRQQGRPNPNQANHPHFNHQQQQAQRRIPPNSHLQQGQRPAGQVPRNPNNPAMSQHPNRNVNSGGMNRPQRPPGQHPPSANSVNNQYHSQQGQRLNSQQNAQSRPINPNAQRPGQQGQQRPNPNSQQRSGQGMSNGTNGPPAGPPVPPVLPKGWKREEVIRTKGISSGIIDVVYAPSASVTDLPPGKKFRSKLELHRYFGNRYDMSLLDYRSGKLSQVNWRKSRRMKSLAMNNTNYASAAKYDNYLNLPIRQTASIFKQSVTYKTNNHKNETPPAHVINPPANKTSEKTKPSQLFWEMRFNNMRAVDSRHLGEQGTNLVHEFELRNIPKFKSFSISNENVLRSVATSWYLNQSKALIGQEKEFGKNARIFIDREQPLIPQTAVKENEIKMQEQKLKALRKKVQLALKEFESMDYMTIDELDEAENKTLEQVKGELDKSNQSTTPTSVPTPTQTAVTVAEPKKNGQEELIVL